MKEKKMLFDSVIEDIKGIISAGTESAYRAASRAMVLTYWEIGKRIVEDEQNGRLKL